MPRKPKSLWRVPALALALVSCGVQQPHAVQTSAARVYPHVEGPPMVIGVETDTTTTTSPPVTAKADSSRSVNTGMGSGSSSTPGMAAGFVNGYPCGATLPPCCVLARESGGNPTAHNPTSSAAGLWQFLSSTWLAYGGGEYAPTADKATWQEQNVIAARAWADSHGHWNPPCW